MCLFQYLIIKHYANLLCASLANGLISTLTVSFFSTSHIGSCIHIFKARGRDVTPCILYPVLPKAILSDSISLLLSKITFINNCKQDNHLTAVTDAVVLQHRKS